MAKMDSSWDLIPGKNLEKALNRAAKLLTPQEVLLSLHSDINFILLPLKINTLHVFYSDPGL
jgi:hypothetical protein